MVVAIADSGGTVLEDQGRDFDAADRLEAAARSVVDGAGVVPAGREAILDAAVDIWIPAARPDVPDAGEADRLRARLVLEGAHIPATAEAEARLRARGLLCVRDVVADAGGVIRAAVEHEGATETTALRGFG